MVGTAGPHYIHITFLPHPHFNHANSHSLSPSLRLKLRSAGVEYLEGSSAGDRWNEDQVNLIAGPVNLPASSMQLRASLGPIPA